ncbi:MAG: hypothetical protein VKP62_04275 [Candidatus Sericytochromatia bacterium]|nr:hypothetical protein [Candidatus Sericytochromatia bacterium]
MYFKCYYHPKEAGPHQCKGCKLPLCKACVVAEERCPRCARSRAAVDNLQAMRVATAAKSRVASSTTARLRLALKQVGPLARRGLDTATLGTVLLPRRVEPGALATPTPAVKPLAPGRARSPAWTYDPDKLAYRAARAVQRVAQPASGSPGVARAWFQAFFTGVSLSLVVLALGCVVSIVLTGHPPRLSGVEGRFRP